MSTLTIEDVYECHVKPRSIADRLKLLELTAHDLSEGERGNSEKPQGLSRFLGAAQGSFATSAEADTFIRQERDAWES